MLVKDFSCARCKQSVDGSLHFDDEPYCNWCLHWMMWPDWRVWMGAAEKERGHIGHIK